MKLKLDENLGERGRELLVKAGHDVATVPGQKLQKAVDKELIRRSRPEIGCHLHGKKSRTECWPKV